MILQPNQALSCGSRPPYEAFPSRPQRSRPPECVDPDRWPERLHNTRYTRRVDARGSVQVSKDRYYIGRRLRGRYVVLRLDAADRQFVVELDGRPLKVLPIKGLRGEWMPCQAYPDLMCQEALAEWRQYLRHRTPHRPIAQPVQQALF